MIKFIILVNKFGQTRISQYFEELDSALKKTLESELVRKCLSRNPDKSFVIEHLDYKVVFRRYASLYFIIGVDLAEENPMAYYILIHRFVQILDSYFGNVCELDIMFNLDKVYYILEEMIQNGDVVDNNENVILGPLKVLDNVN